VPRNTRQRWGDVLAALYNITKGQIMRYGGVEWTYAEPIARALQVSDRFRRWFLSQTRFRDQAFTSRLLHEEMKAQRSAAAESWWRSHYTEKCRCAGCSGQETDLLAVFDDGGFRFALHVEIKRPGDRFPAHKDQAGNYRLRALCWSKQPPTAVVRHEQADTVLICAESQMAEFAPHLAKFGSVLTFASISAELPHECTPMGGL